MGRYPEIGGIPGKLLGMQADLSLKIRDGTLSIGEFEAFLKRQNPFPEPVSEKVDLPPHRLGTEQAQELNEQVTPRVVRGSDFVLGVEEASRFLRDFGGVVGVDCAKFAQSPMPTDRPHWAYPVYWTMEELIGLIERKSVRRRDYAISQMRRVRADSDPRQPEKSGRLVFTPAGLESNETNPELVDVSYRKLQSKQYRHRVNTACEAIHLWLLVDFVSGGDLCLDVTSWNRTCSASLVGCGVGVSGGARELGVDWLTLNSASNPGGSRPVV